MAISFDFNDINRRAVNDPRGLLAECDAALNTNLAMAAAAVATHSTRRPVVLLAGPSGSGKTTTAGKLGLALSYIGIRAHVLSMDDYFLTLNPETHPKDKRGNIDFESPDCLDIPLLTRHFTALASGHEVEMPRYDFTRQMRAEDPGRIVRLRSEEVAIFEGIHALNPALLKGDVAATRVYVSARSNIRRNGELFFKGTWLRLVRRIIRDDNFRGWDAARTMQLWANVRRGEKLYISPYKHLADITIDTALAYETPVLRDHAIALFSEVPETVERLDELRQVRPCLEAFSAIDISLLSVKSLLREFIGGGVL